MYGCYVVTPSGAYCFSQVLARVLQFTTLKEKFLSGLFAGSRSKRTWYKPWMCGSGERVGDSQRSREKQGRRHQSQHEEEQSWGLVVDQLVVKRATSLFRKGVNRWISIKLFFYLRMIARVNLQNNKMSGR